MSEALARLAAMVGIENRYVSLTGETVEISDEARRATLQAMGIPAGSEEEIAAAMATLTPIDLDGMTAPEGVACFVPDWLRHGRAFGIGCQLYGLRSRRNWGIGDFEDLARFAEIAGEAGADFVGVNPLHALFASAPERASPFYPSTRRFLNVLYIAVDRVPGYAGMEDAIVPPEGLREAELVDYRHVAETKLKALSILFRIFQVHGGEAERDDYERFVAAEGTPLYLHALFEALSQAMTQQGNGPTWHGWPEEFRHPGSDSVRAFAEEQRELVAFHSWLQWLADRQLRSAAARAREAGLRIGFYLDLAVGVAPDGSATWSDRDLAVPTARIGAPPDYFNEAGQDWGLAPLSPAELVRRDLEPYRDSIGPVLRHAGAIRIDHAMSLYRLFWIAEGFGAADGVYVRYPFHAMLRMLAALSQDFRTIVIGEDLGVVPSGFREVMQRTEIQSYRVFFFERREDHFIPPEDYPREALACVTTHDLHSLAGWWSGHDLEERHRIGMIAADEMPATLAERAHMRRRLLGLLDAQGLLPQALEAVMRGEAEPPLPMPEDLVVALHVLVARAPSRLFIAQIEDLAGMAGQTNIPGTLSEHPNWRRRLPVDLEELPRSPLFRAVTEALRKERPRAP